MQIALALGQTQFVDTSFPGLSCFSLAPELRIKRQNSSDSISSLNSITSHSSIGSSKDTDAKKKKKKSWVGWMACWEEEQGLGSLWQGLADVNPTSQLLLFYLGIVLASCPLGTALTRSL